MGYGVCFEEGFVFGIFLSLDFEELLRVSKFYDELAGGSCR